MRRQDDQAGIAHADQHHQDEVRRRLVVADLAGRAALFEVAQAGFVAMMAVGDEHRLGTEQAGHGADDVLIGDGPQPADDAEMIGRLQRQRAADQRRRAAS